MWHKKLVPNPFRARFDGTGFANIVGSILVLFIITGCGQQNQRSTTTGSQATFQNPVIRTNFPDPSILQVDNVFYAYATNGNGKNIQVARSTDLVHWTLLPDALPNLPSWAQSDASLTWAPDVIQIGSHYGMYYTGRDITAGKQCVGVATSTEPAGPFVDHNASPLVCQVNQGGTIDPYPFPDADKLYLYFKNDGNCCGLTTYIYVQPLTSDGLHVTGNPTPLIHNDQAWEGNVTEAPSMFQHSGKYYLFFSGGNYADTSYAVGYATCQTAQGPCQQASNNPILASKAGQPPVIGPGGQSVFQVGNQTWMVYHAWHVNSAGIQGNSRYMWLDRIIWQNGKPLVHGPTTGPQPMPTIS